MKIFIIVDLRQDVVYVYLIRLLFTFTFKFNIPPISYIYLNITPKELLLEKMGESLSI